MTAQAFFNELQKIISSRPKYPTKVLYSENCEYGNELYFCKRVFWGFDDVKCTDCSYIYDSFLCAQCLDCDYAVESELCYESVDPFKCFNCNYIEYCANLQDSSYCYNCYPGKNLFGCVNLQNKSFCIFNRQLTEDEYKEKIKIYKTWAPERVLAEVEKLKKLYPIMPAVEAHNENTIYGNYIHYDKNCYLCFDAAHDENGAYLYDTFEANNTLDATYCGDHADLSYEVVSSARLFNCNYVYWSEKCQDSSYLFNCLNVKNSLGCVDLAHKQYCILNRQFSKEEYEKISAEILSEITKSGLRWDNLTV